MANGMLGWPTAKSLFGPRPDVTAYGPRLGQSHASHPYETADPLSHQKRMAALAAAKGWDANAARLDDAQGMNAAMALGAMAGPLLQAAGPTKMPVSFAQAAGAGLPQMMQIMQQGPRDFLGNEAAMMKLQDAQTARRTAAANLAATKEWQTKLPENHPAKNLAPADAVDIYKETIKAGLKKTSWTRGTKGVKDGVPGVWRFDQKDPSKKVFVSTPGIKTGSASERIRERLQRHRSEPTSEEYGQAFADLYLRPHMSQDAGGKSVLIPASPIPRNAILPTLPDNGGQRFSPEAYEAAGYKFVEGKDAAAPRLVRTLERKKTLTQQQQMVIEDEIAVARQGLEDVGRALELVNLPGVVGVLSPFKKVQEWWTAQLNPSKAGYAPAMDFQKAMTDIRSVDWKSYVGGGGLSKGDREWLNKVIAGTEVWDTPRLAVQTLERLQKMGRKKLYRKLVQSGEINIPRHYAPAEGVEPKDMSPEEYERFTAWRMVYPERFRRWRSRRVK